MLSLVSNQSMFIFIA